LGEIKEDNFYGKDVIAALDLSSKRDFTCLGIINPVTFEFLPYFWIPDINLQNRSYRDQIMMWVDQGFVEVTQGNVVDYNAIRQKIDQLSSKMNIVEIAYDPWNSTQLVNNLMDDGANMIEHRQGFASMSPAIKELEQLVLTKKFNHGGNPVLKWQNSNVTLKEDPAGNIKLDKAKSTEKIDGMVVLAMCIGRAIFGDWKDLIQKSIYETDGDISI
ncbi:MAG: terminase TerL endonuclease subunit, partial [Candidatus Anammoxibacter sp.]